MICSRYETCMRWLCGVCVCTLYVGRWLQLLLDLCWRVCKWTTIYDQVEQRNRIANCFWAENGRSESYIDWTSRYLKDIGVEVRCGGGLISCKSERAIILQMEWRFSEKPSQSLIYWVAGWYRSKNYWVWCLLGDDVAFGKFIEQNFPTFSAKRIETKYFDEFILYLIEFYSFNAFANLSIFLEIWNCSSYPNRPFANLGNRSCRFFGFLQLGVNYIFAWI